MNPKDKTGIPRQLTKEQREQVEQDYESINRLGEQYGINAQQQQRSSMRHGRQGAISDSEI